MTPSALSCSFCSFLLEEIQKRVTNERDIGVINLNIWLGFDLEPAHAFDRMYVMDNFSEGGNNGYEVGTTFGKHPNKRG